MLNLVAKKIGMTHVYESNGTSFAITAIQLCEATVLEESLLDQKSKKVLIGYQKIQDRKLSKPESGFYKKLNIDPHKNRCLSTVNLDFSFKIKDSLDYQQFIKKGNFVSVRGVTTGKGFSGAMKRWNFRGLEASHGVSISHRSHGSTGQRQDPGKTFRGKKMAGHLGCETVTIKNLEIFDFDKDSLVLLVKGSVPGKSNSSLFVRVAN